jgi:hypothetical protein
MCIVIPSDQADRSADIKVRKSIRVAATNCALGRRFSTIDPFVVED